ncbi:MAG TPA: gamma-glutamyltransferase [Terriglobia bacterium]|nr:gamma-glutamyltransferase [Terriglobia bacterium]
MLRPSTSSHPLCRGFEPAYPPRDRVSPWISSNISRTFLLATLALIFALPAWPLTPVAAKHGMVVTAEPHASDVGVEIMKAGGNAVDAAVAVGFALAVTYPYAGNIGGGGFMLIRMAHGEAVMIDYREEAPAAASHNMYLDAHGEMIPKASTIGPLAIGVPGTVAGLALAEQKYGKLGLARVLEPAIRLADEGFVVDYELSQSLLHYQERFSKFAETTRIFLRSGHPYEAGEIFHQPELAQTLRQIAQSGPDVFYRGPVAKAIVATMEREHGLITAKDLENYQAKIREPLRGHYHGYEIVTVPPPSSGGVALIEMLNILGSLDLGPANSFQSVHLMTEAMRRAYADRAAYLGDSDFVSVPVAGLTNPNYAEKIAAEISHGKADAPVQAGTPAAYESSETTHYSVIDAEGNAVSNTYTLNGGYGSLVTVEGAGFLLNNEMDDFASKPGSPNMFGLIQGEANAIAPQKRPLSSMTPTIVLEETPTHQKEVRLILGSPGGGTIINTVLEVLLNVVQFKMDVLQAVTAPRFHHQWMPDRLALERVGFSADTLQKLREAGYSLTFVDNLGDCEAIAVSPDEGGWRFGAADPRSEGKAAGY